MKASPLSLRDVTFLRVHVEVDRAFKGRARGFDFDGVQYHSSVRHGQHEAGTREWWVGVEFATRSTEEKPCPYEVDSLAVGLFDVADSFPAERREELIYENGAALVFGAIREMVATVTGRGVYGPMFLPTASFVGEFAKYKSKANEPDTPPAAAD